MLKPILLTAGIGLLLSIGLLAGCTNREKLKWHQDRGYRWASLTTSNQGRTGFEKLDPSTTDITFENHLTKDEIDENQHYMNGSGVAAGDIDGDGWTDLYFASLNGPNRLYKNKGGFEFEDVTEVAGVGHEEHRSTGTVFADVDGDGDLDLLVGSISKGVSLYLNDSQGHFTKREGKIEVGKGNMTMTLADVDGDSDLDLYVANYKEKPVKDLYANDELTWNKTIAEKGSGNSKRYELVPPFDEHYTIIRKENAPNDRRETGEVDALYLNGGDGTFRKVESPEQRFLSPDGTPQGLGLDWSLNASFQDINQDGRPDLYVNNDFWTPDRFWINQGDGVFRAIDSLAIRSSSLASMAVDFSDFNRDGAQDFFITEMLSPKHQRRLRQFNVSDPFPADRMDNRPQYNRNSLYLNRGDQTFAEISYFSGVEASEWSWATRFIDVDLDGYEDLLVNTGFSYDLQDLDSQQRMGRRMARTASDDRYLTEYPRLKLKNKSFYNDRDLTFSKPSSNTEGGFTERDEKDVSYGMATADLDHDGDLDLAVSRLNATAAIYENKTTAPRIAVRLSGNRPNTQAIGAKVAMKGGKGGPAPQQEEMVAGGDYLSGSDPFAFFAAKADNANHTLIVMWPNGARTEIDSVRANRIYDIQQPQATANSADSSGSASSNSGERNVLFEDVSSKISHRHRESSYDDFHIQPLLPMKLSQQGPGISWVDYDADDDDDLFIASGRGGRLAVYENEGNGVFAPQPLGAVTGTTSTDQTTILGWRTDQGTQLLVGNANYESGNVEEPSALHYMFRGGASVEREHIPGKLSTTGPLSAADYDGDGDLDLFVGGRFLPAQYPADATSRLFRNENGRFVLDEVNSERLGAIGLVTGSVFTDYDVDGDPDLLISREWDSLKLYENEDGSFRDVSEQTGLAHYTGWWNGVTTGDFNNDGRPDIVATNWGNNSPYQLDAQRPLKMYYGDLNKDRRVDILEAYYEPKIGSYVPRRKLMAFEEASLSFVSRIQSHRQFAHASLEEILGYDPETRLSSKAINTTAHMLFLSEGDRFEPQPLPDEAQFSAAFHAGVADYNNDGNEDLFLSQNFFNVRPQSPRLDAGRGLLLKGDGDGHFEMVPGHVSGLTVYGEQRGAAFSDFNSDGKVDLAVSQNGAATKLYENRMSKRGIVIRLQGVPSNREGIGASIRLVYPDGSKGPRREIQAGSGYWSQKSLTQVMGFSRPPEKIEVRWPDGDTETVKASINKQTHVIRHSKNGF